MAMVIEGKQTSGTFQQGYPGYKPREGVLRSRMQRAIFCVGIAALFIAAVVVSLLR
jgi:hypothetical protein